MKEQIISSEFFQKGMETLEALLEGPPPPKQRYKGKEAAAAYKPIIDRLLKRGFDHDQINKALESAGVVIGLSNLKRHLRDAEKEKRTAKKKIETNESQQSETAGN